MKRQETAKSEAERLVIGLSGASGVAYGIRMLEALRDLGVETHLVMTKPAEMTIGYETELSPKQVAAKADYTYAVTDIAAPIASGSFRTRGMIVAPCSVRTMTALAEMGAIILPPVPAFYAEPKTLSDLVDQMVGRALDLFGYDWPDMKRWGETIAKSRRKKSVK